MPFTELLLLKHELPCNYQELMTINDNLSFKKRITTRWRN